jgi:hypothetical protein
MRRMTIPEHYPPYNDSASPCSASGDGLYRTYRNPGESLPDETHQRPAVACLLSPVQQMSARQSYRSQ